MVIQFSCLSKMLDENFKKLIILILNFTVARLEFQSSQGSLSCKEIYHASKEVNICER
jgi:hypothetical protein